MLVVSSIIVVTVLSACACATDAQKGVSPTASEPIPSGGASRRPETRGAPLVNAVSQCAGVFSVCASFVRAVNVDSTHLASGGYDIFVDCPNERSTYAEY